MELKKLAIHLVANICLFTIVLVALDYTNYHILLVIPALIYLGVASTLFTAALILYIMGE